MRWGAMLGVQCLGWLDRRQTWYERHEALSHTACCLIQPDLHPVTNPPCRPPLNSTIPLTKVQDNSPASSITGGKKVCVCACFLL